MTPAADRQPKTRDERGFTLLELLIAMSLLGLVLAALTGGLRFGTTAWHVGSARLAENEDLQLVHRVLRRQISGAFNAEVDGPGSNRSGLFEGGRDRLSFVGPPPAAAMASGLYRFTLELAPDGGSKALTLGWGLLGGEPSEPDPEDLEPLLRGVDEVRFRYFGDPHARGDPRWIDEWKNIKEIPLVVQIVVKFSDPVRAPWPPLEIATAAGSGPPGHPAAIGR